MTKSITSQESQICYCFLTNLQAEGDLTSFLRKLLESELEEIEQIEIISTETSQTENLKLLEIKKRLSEVSKSISKIEKLIKVVKTELPDELFEGKIKNKSDLLTSKVNFHDVKKNLLEERLNFLNKVETKSKIEVKEIEVLNKLIENEETIVFFKIKINYKSDLNYNDLIEEIQKEHKMLIQLFKKITKEAKYQILITSCLNLKSLKQINKLKGELEKTFNSQIFSNPLKMEIGDPSISQISMDIKGSKYNFEYLSLGLKEGDLRISTRNSLICKELSIENLLGKYFEILNILIERNEGGKDGKM
ncbi:hypothetical protein LCGC14_0789640 [marine sediment metagenome]|uniref:Uncharacterized protein n=1 Tax=marine sediment metagenome TaxID=412755 RepID=A0A0F9PT35_9ZZZZ